MTIKRGPYIASSTRTNIVSMYDPLNPSSYISGGLWYDRYDHSYSGSVDSAQFNNNHFSTNGTDQQLNAGHNLNFTPSSGSDFSISLWVNLKDNNKQILNKKEQFGMRITGDNRISVIMRSSNDNRDPYQISWVPDLERLYVRIQRGGNHDYGFRIYDKDLNLVDDELEYQPDGNGTAGRSYSYMGEISESSMWASSLSRVSELSLPDMTELQVGTYTYAVGTDLNHVSFAYGITLDDDYVYIVNRNNHRLNKITRSTLEMHSMSGTASAGDGEDQFSGPYGMCSDDTFLYVCDYNNDRIKKHYKSDLSFHSMSGSEGSGQDQYNGPYGIIISGSYLYITDLGNDRIKIHNKDTLAYINMVSTYDSPRGLALTDNHLYVTSLGTGKILKYTKDLELVKSVGIQSTYTSTINSPYCYGMRGIRYHAETDKIYSIDRGARFKGMNQNRTTFDDYVAIGKGDTYDLCMSGSEMFMAHNNRDTIGKYTFPGGAFISESVQVLNGTGSEEYNGPSGIDCDDTYVYVADTVNHRIKKHLKSDLSFVAMTGSYGTGDHQFGNPYAIRIIDNKLVVADYTFSKLKIYDKDLTYITASSETFAYQYKFTYDDDYIYGVRAGGSDIYKYNRSDYSNKQTFSIPQGEHMGERGLNYGIACVPDEGLLFMAGMYQYRIFETTSGSHVGQLGVWDSSIWTSPNTVELNKWHNIIYSIDDTNHYLYVDGVLEKSASFIERFQYDNISDLILGTQTGRDVTNYSEENIGMITVYNKVLTEAEAYETYKGMKSRYL